MRSVSRQSRFAALWVLTGALIVLLAPGSATAQSGVFPDSEWTDSLLVSTSGHTAEFNVIPPGNVYGDVEVSCWGMPCSFVNGQSADTVSMFAWMDHYIDVDFSTPSQDGNRTLYMGAQDLTGAGFTDTGSRIYTLVPPVEVSAQSVPSSVTQHADDQTATYTVTNSGSAKTFDMSCTWGPAECSVSPTSKYLGSGASTTVTTTFDAGSTAGSFTLRLDAESGSDSGYHSQSVTVNEFVSVNSVASRSPVYAPPNTSMSDTFAIRFPGQSATTFEFTCTPSASCSDPADANIGDSEVLIPVSYTSPANGDTLTLTLTAEKKNDPTVSADGTLEVVSTNQILLTVDDANPGLEEIRSECITIAAGPGMFQCDDFVYHYPFTAVNRMNKTYELGLIYNSGQRAPQITVGANVVLPPGVAEPDSLNAVLRTLTPDTVVRKATSYTSAQYRPGEKTRLAFSAGINPWGGVSDHPVKYDVTVTPYSGGSAQASVTAEGYHLRVDNRSYLGRGWWLAGWERLEVVNDPDLGAVLVWVGGDGSSRLYLPEGTDTWVAVTRSRPDTIVKSGGEYHRMLIGGGKVIFGSAGAHLRTVSRTGAQTRFVTSQVNGKYRLTSIDVTTPSGSWDTIFQFDYDTSANVLLSEVKVIGATGGWDVYQVAEQVDGGIGRLMSITSPDGRSVDFHYSGSGARLDSIFTYPTASDTVVTRVEYAWMKARKIKVSAPGEPTIVTLYDAPSLRGAGNGIWTPRPVEDVAGLLDGPRSVSDTTLFYPTPWGGVRGIRDPEGNETWIDYDDPNYPGLPTRVRHPNGWEVTASYHGNGLLDEVTDRSTGGVTRYQWNSTWSQPTRITSPEGVDTWFTYDTGGNRTSRSVGKDTVMFRYDANMQMKMIISATNDTTLLAYDSKGNLSSETGPASVGSWTHYERDGRGYPKRVAQAIGTASDSRVVETQYDAVGRVVQDSTWSSADDMWLRMTHTYDTHSGLRTQTEAWGGATANASTTTGTSEWEYDPFGRVIVESSPVRTDSMVYDLAGNVVERINDGKTISMTYDGMGRLTRRSVSQVSYPYQSEANGWNFPVYETSGLTIGPVTDTLTYDAMGNLHTANNNVSHITRTYYLNGALKSDQQALKEYGSTSFTTHVYDLAYDYDLDGRRTAVHHPSWLSSGSDRTDYHYDQDTGRLTTVTDPLGNTYGFTYNGNGQPVVRTYPVGGDSLSYDATGRLEYYNGLTVTRDKTGLVTFAGGTAYTYNGFGHLLESDDVGSDVYEYFERDAFGNASFHHSFPRFEGPSSDPGSAFANNHPAQKGGQISVAQEEWTFSESPNEPFEWEPGWRTYTYESGSGHRIATGSETYNWHFWGGTEGYDNADKLATHRSYARSYYAADGKLRVHQINRDSLDYRYYDPPQDTTIFYGKPWGAYEEYWYDALGRRVLKRSRQESPICTHPDRCYSSIERFVWDGDQILWELRQSGAGDTKDPSGSAYTGQTGNVGYVHAAGIDAPLGMVRNGNTVILRRNWRGLYQSAKDVNGNAVATDVRWPAVNWAVRQDPIDPREVHTWIGTLPLGQQDDTGLNYRRNRYYDPESGQFTQQDPIGIAGGLNLYGYADGDPINFSDPFGLCPKEAGGDGETEGFEDCPLLSSGWFANRLATGEGIGLLNELGGAVASLMEVDVCADAGMECVTGTVPDIGPGGPRGLIRDFLDNPQSWKRIGAFVERATNRRARGGTSIQEIFENARGNQMIQHTVRDQSGNIIDGPHPRPFFVPRLNDLWKGFFR